ncbi:MAG: MarR family winged helix-turn-helix transcriptional regulator [Clostridium sp.]
MDINNLQILIEQFMRITNKINELHNCNINFNGSSQLSTGEIHLIECIGKHQDSNVTEISNILGNTRGAVSQMAKKLEKKGLIVKTKKGDNNKEIILQLSKEGNEIFLEHENFHLSLYEDILSTLDSSSEENIKVVKNILNSIEKYINQYAKDSKITP